MGAVAQLGERHDGIVEVWGSIPHCSTTVGFASYAGALSAKRAVVVVIEASATLALFGVLAAFSGLRAWCTPFGLLSVGAILTGLGAAFSTLGGLGYHWTLWATLGRRGALPPRWVWRPTSLHASLRASERVRVLPWFVLGATGFVLVVAGGVLVLAAGRGSGWA